MRDVIKQVEELNKQHGIIAVAKLDYRVLVNTVDGYGYSAYTRSIGDRDKLILNKSTITVANLRELAPNPGDKVFLAVNCDGYFDWEQVLNSTNYSLAIETVVEKGNDGRVVDLVHDFASYAVGLGGCSVKSEDNLTNITGIIDFEKLQANGKTHVFALADGHKGKMCAEVFKARFPVLMLEKLRGNIEFLIPASLFNCSETPQNTIQSSLRTSTAIGAVILSDGSVVLRNVESIISSIKSGRYDRANWSSPPR